MGWDTFLVRPESEPRAPSIPRLARLVFLLLFHILNDTETAFEPGSLVRESALWARLVPRVNLNEWTLAREIENG